MRLDDEQIERYSRQLILQEVGPRGQERLLASRVTVVGTDSAAAHVVAYLAAAGVGGISAHPALRNVIDPAQPDCVFTPLDALVGDIDALVVSAPPTVAGAPAIDAVADALIAWRARAPIRLWTTAGYAGGAPPCPRCALDGRSPCAVPPPLGTLHAAVLGPVVATEVVKAILGIGSAAPGRLWAYDVATATIEHVRVTAHPSCDCGSA